MLNVISRTPYLSLDAIGRPDIFLKLECNQFGGSFKSRGVVNFLKYVGPINGLITFTTGNHGIAVAAISRRLGKKAIIVSTNKLSIYKKTIIESFGAEVRLIDSYSLDFGTNYAKTLANEKEYIFVPLFDNEYLLDGYSHIAREICNDFSGDLTLLFPVGSGSLLLANSKLAKSLNPINRVIGVEPEIFQRLNTIQQASSSKSIADGLSIDRIPASNLKLVEFTDKIETTSEDEIINAIRLLYRQFNTVMEPSGAITLAVALKTNRDYNKKIAVITGKNISPEAFSSLISKKETHP